MSRPTRCITIALASLAVAAPAASAMVVDPLPAGSSAPTQDLRNPDQRVPAQVADMHASTAMAVKHSPQGSVSQASGDGTSPLVYILPGAALLAALGAATGFAVSTGRFPGRHAHA